MTSVGSVDPWSAGDGCDLVDPDGNNTESGSDAPADGLPHSELLIGFLTDFHAAAREPAAPEPAKKEPAAAGPLPSRFAAFAPPDPNTLDDGADHLVPAEPLPVWPPVPVPQATGPVRDLPSDVSPDQAKPSLFRRLGRRG